MLLKDFFDHLTYEVFAQYNIGTDDAGQINEKDYPRLATLTNSSLTKLHTRLALRYEQVLVQTQKSQTIYNLSSKYALSTAPEVDDGSPRYILDATDPFQDNILLITAVTDSDGCEFALNDENSDKAVFTTSHNRLQIPNPDDSVVAVLYQANHPKLPVSRSMDPSAITLDIPEYCVDALAYQVGSRVIGSGGNAESFQEGRMLLQNYEMELQSIIDAGLVAADQPTNQRTWKERWV